MNSWLWIDGPVLASVDDPAQLTADAIDALAAWSFYWPDERNVVMLCDPEPGPIRERPT